MNDLFGSETQKARENFPFSYHPASLELIHGMTLVKKAAAVANAADGGISQEQAAAIIKACDEILAGTHDQQFVTCALQGGAGTSINMNLNEVIATLAKVHPLDHVNKSQSTNDVNPSGAKLACYGLLRALIAEIDQSVAEFSKKAEQWQQIAKLGRTHLQDAVPTTVGAEFAGYAATLRRDQQRLTEQLRYLLELNLGGTAIGSMLNASETYRTVVYQKLAEYSQLAVTPGTNLTSQTNSQADFVALSSMVLVLMTDLSKIANDIRLLVSGPKGGFAELRIPEVQKGSTIMPGKVNPVICEVVNQTAFLIAGYHVTVQKAAEAAQLELGVMFPILIDALIQSLVLSRQVLHQFTTLVIVPLEVNQQRCQELLEHSTAYATIFSPLLGHDTMSQLVKESLANNVPILTLIREKKLVPEAEIKKLLQI